MASILSIRSFVPTDEPAVIALWQACQLTRPWNDPHQDIARKLTTQPELFAVGEVAGATAGAVLVASAMFGYDGHRGWVNFLAVDPAHQGSGHARSLMAWGEAQLKLRGCPKINLQVRSTNQAVLAMYARLGYEQDNVISLGKRLIADEPPG